MTFTTTIRDSHNRNITIVKNFPEQLEVEILVGRFNVDDVKYEENGEALSYPDRVELAWFLVAQDFNRLPPPRRRRSSFETNNEYFSYLTLYPLDLFIAIHETPLFQTQIDEYHNNLLHHIAMRCGPVLRWGTIMKNNILQQAITIITIAFSHISQPVPIDQKNSDNQTPLHLALSMTQDLIFEEGFFGLLDLALKTETFPWTHQNNDGNSILQCALDAIHTLLYSGRTMDAFLPSFEIFLKKTSGKFDLCATNNAGKSVADWVGSDSVLCFSDRVISLFEKHQGLSHFSNAFIHCFLVLPLYENMDNNLRPFYITKNSDPYKCMAKNAKDFLYYLYFVNIALRNKAPKHGTSQPISKLPRDLLFSMSGFFSTSNRAPLIVLKCLENKSFLLSEVVQTAKSALEYVP